MPSQAAIAPGLQNLAGVLRDAQSWHEFGPALFEPQRKPSTEESWVTYVRAAED